MTMDYRKPHMSFGQILNMNVGFFGLQFSFGLQQANMSPIYSYLGADPKTLPLLWLAGPVTGLLVQPIIGALSDRTVSRMGRRKPYFLIGAIIASICLVLMPFSPALWAAASLLWILDAASNVTMEPYRAFVSDRLDEKQHSLGFLTQSAFTGLGQTLAYLSPSILVFLGMSRDAVAGNNIPYMTIAAFMIGAVLSIGSVMWTHLTTKELPLDEAEKAEMKAKPFGLLPALAEIWDAFKNMPQTMRQLAVMKLFQWYGLFTYWMYIVHCVASSLFNTTDPASEGFREATLVNGQIGATYNFIAFVAAFALVPLVKRIGARYAHALCLLAAGIAMMAIPLVDNKAMLFLPMIGIGLAWGSIMGNPYVMLAGSLPKDRVGVYMGIFNMFIVIPMMIQSVSMPWLYENVLKTPDNAIRLAGICMLCAAVAVLFVKVKKSASHA